MFQLLNSWIYSVFYYWWLMPGKNNNTDKKCKMIDNEALFKYEHKN